MGILSQIDTLTGRDQALPVEEDTNQFSRGLRSGMTASEGQLHALGGSIAEAAGFDQAAADQYAQSRAAQQQAAEEAPRVTSYKDVDSLRSGFDYVSGLAGQSVPAVGAAVGAGLLTGGRGLRPLIGATAATAPLEAGNAVQRQMDDPEAMQKPAGERLAVAAATGVGSAALQNIVPLAVTGQLERAAAAGASRASRGAIVARNAAVGVGGEAAANTGAELLQQQSHGLLNPNRDTSGDADALKEAFVGGAAVGAPLAGVGAARELAQHRGPDIVARTRDLFSGKQTKEPVDLSEARRVAADEELIDPASLDGKSPAEASKLFEEADASRAQKASQWAQDLFGDKSLPPEQRMTLETAMQDLRNRTNQAAVAGIKVARDVGNNFSSQVSDLYDSTIGKKDAARSDVQTNLSQRVSAELTPLLQQSLPELASRPADVGRLSEVLSDVIEKARTDSGVNEVTLGKLQNLLGEQTRPILQQLHDNALSDNDPVRTDNFYKLMTKLADEDTARRTLTESVRAALKPEIANNVSPQELQAAVDHIKDFVAERHTGNMTKHQAEMHKRDVRAALAEHFGDKTDSVLNLFAGEVKKSAKASTVDDRAPLTEEENGSVDAADQYEKPRYYGKKPYAKREGDGASQYERELAKARQENPDRNVNFVEARDLPEDHPHFNKDSSDGFVVAEGMKQEGRLTADELDAMRLDTSKTSHLKNASRIDTGVHGVTLDAKRMTSVMHKKLPFNASDDKSILHRRARAFMEAVAAAQDAIGKSFDVKDDVVVDKRGGKDVTFGELKKLSMRPEDPAWMKDKSPEEINERLRSEEALREASDAELKRYKASLEKIIDTRETAHAEFVKELRDNRITLSKEDFKRTLKEHGLDPANKHVQALARVNAEIESRTVEGTAKERVADGVRHGTEVSPDANIHDAVAANGEKGVERKVGLDGNALQYDSKGDGLVKADGSLSANGRRALDSRLSTLEGGKTAAQRTLGAKGRALEAIADTMNAKDQMQFARVIKMTDTGEVAGIINRLAEKYKVDVAPRDVMFNAQAVKDPAKMDAYINGEKFNSITDPAVMVRFLRAARERMDALLAKQKEADEAWEMNAGDDMELTSQERDVLEWTQAQFVGDRGDLAPFLTELDAFQVLPADQQKALLAEVEGLKAKKPKGQASQQTTGAGEITPEQMKAVEDHVEKVLGQSVLTEFKKMFHAGEFERLNGHDILRVSVHALDPMSVAYHESLHAFMAKLRDAGEHDAIKTLFKTADSVMVKNQLKKLLDGEPAALRQITDSSEERAAYMYQFWAAGKLQLGEKGNGVMKQIADFFRKVLGIWSNDDRSQHILEYFNSGDYAKNMNDRSAVAMALDKGNSKAVKQARKMTQPLANLSAALASAGDARLRRTKNPSLVKLADLILRETTGEGVDPGFIPAAREKRTQVLNDLASDLKNINAEDLQAALEALQNNKPAVEPGARSAAKVIRGMLDDMFDYMRDAGVEVRDLGYGKDYFPRVWDDAYLSSHQKEFFEMLQPYVDSGKFKGSKEQLLARLTRQEGSEVGIETNTPGMQHVKERSLNFISAEDAAPFLRKDLFHTLNSYVTQATRRAEWARRFGDNGAGLRKLLADAKNKHGATNDEIQTAEQHVRGVDGTLGDDINPTLRRTFGNVMVYQNIRLLPLAIFSSVVDPMGVMVRGGSVGEAFDTLKRGVKEISNTFKKDGGNKDDATRLAEDLGVIDNAVLMQTLGTSYSQGMVGDTARKINDTFFKYNLMAGFTNSVRVGATQAAIGFLGRHADGSASPHSKRWLAELGFAPNEVKVVNGRPLVQQHEFEAAGMKPDDAAQAAAKMSVAINRWVDGAVLRPNSAQKPIWMNDPHWALVSHLKQFVYSFQHTIIKRVTHEFEHGNFSPALALTSYVPMMIAADLVKGMIQGGGEQPEWKKGWGADDYLWSGVQRAGLLGVGQFGADVATDIHRGGVGVGALVGPSIEQLSDAVRVIGGPGQAEPFLLKSMPANALYSESVRRGE